MTIAGLLGTLVGQWGIVVGAIISAFTIIKLNSEYQKRKLEETKVNASEQKAGATAIIKLEKANEEIKEEFEKFQKAMKEEKKDLENRFEIVRRNCEESLHKFTEYMVNGFLNNKK
jgi:biopolymer transport protein ExbB/TolQ